MSIKKVVVAGGGVLGSQIAFQTAYCGFDVTVWLRSPSSITRTQPKLDAVRGYYIQAIEKMKEQPDNPAVFARGIADRENFDAEECRKKVENAYNSIKIELDLAAAVKDADLVIESMAEEADAKKTFYKTLAPLLPEKPYSLPILRRCCLRPSPSLRAVRSVTSRFISQTKSGATT